MALALLSVLIAIVIPSVSALTGAYMRETMSKLQGLTRDTYARTALSGNSHRIVFDFEGQAYWVEQTEGGAVMKREKEATGKDGAGVLDAEDERLSGTEDSDDAEDLEKRRLYSGPTWAPVDDELGKPTKLPSGVTFYAVWAEHLEDRVQAGRAAVHFFPGGYMEEAQITLTESEGAEAADDSLTLTTNPLTGETYIEDRIPDIPF